MTKSVSRALFVVGLVGTITGVTLAAVGQLKWSAANDDLDYGDLQDAEVLRSWGFITVIPFVAVLLLGAIWWSADRLLEQLGDAADTPQAIPVDSGLAVSRHDSGVETRLVALRTLRDDGLITDNEYRERRAGIVDAL